MFCYSHQSVVEVTSTVTSQHSELFCLLWSMRITISYSWFTLPRKNFRWRLPQELWTERENGERFFRLSAASTFERKKEASSLFLCCWWSIPLTRNYNENLLRRVSEGINWKTLNYRLCRTRSGGKCVWNHFFSFPSTTEAHTATTTKAKLIVL